MTDQRKLAPRLRARPIKITASLERRFWGKVDTSGGPDACWLWAGKTQNGGYGVLVLDGERSATVYAHRVSWAVATGEDPGGLCVCHRCDTPGCCNHAHHFLGTEGDNSADKVAKGRQARNCGPQRRARGPRLDPERVRDLRRRAAAGEGKAALVAAFGVDERTVRDVLGRRTWAHVA